MGLPFFLPRFQLVCAFGCVHKWKMRCCRQKENGPQYAHTPQAPTKDTVDWHQTGNTHVSTPTNSAHSCVRARPYEG